LPKKNTQSNISFVDARLDILLVDQRRLSSNFFDKIVNNLSNIEAFNVEVSSKIEDFSKIEITIEENITL